MINQETLKQQLHYNPETGVFTRLIASARRVKIGDVAGWLDSTGYIQIMVLGKSYRVHRLAWLYVYGNFPPEQVDHINHVRDDNRIINLRLATHQENNKNASMSKRNKSGITGVFWKKQNRKWQARIMVNRKSIHLGFFTDKFEAICARLSANNKYGFHENHGSIRSVVRSALN